MKFDWKKLRSRRVTWAVGLATSLIVMVAFQNCTPFATCEDDSCSSTSSKSRTGNSTTLPSGSTFTNSASGSLSLGSSSTGYSGGSTGTSGSTGSNSTSGSGTSGGSTSTGSSTGSGITISTGTSGTGSNNTSAGGQGDTPTGFRFEVEPMNIAVETGLSTWLFGYATGTAAGVTYQWFKNGAAIPGATSSTYRISAAAGSDDADYYVIATASGTSIRSANAHISVRPPRNACPAGLYGYIAQAGTSEGFHLAPVPPPVPPAWFVPVVTLNSRLEDSYTTSSNFMSGSIVCGHAMYQCRNGRIFEILNTGNCFEGH